MNVNHGCACADALSGTFGAHSNTFDSLCSLDYWVTKRWKGIIEPREAKRKGTDLIEERSKTGEERGQGLFLPIASSDNFFDRRVDT